MYLIGLTGGIASGKSTVARQLVQHGAVHIDADHLARLAVGPGTPALAQIADAFGPGVLNAEGALDRAALGALVFADPDALSRLNAIVHPAVRAMSNARIREAERADPEAVVVYDVPLLVEAAVDHPFDLVVVTQADEETRVRRMVDLRAMDAGEAERRIRSQASDAERLAIADVVLETGGTLEQTLEQVDLLWEQIHAGREDRTVRAAP
ncbi:dephospho-CoA kinase [Cryobacterium sp. TMT1-21]|uniref:Dephospho-CoA kinase n=1 Tax=Cryobacterium shii TaxID=1259235 RepID=A0AAQ2C750_9MICO|nr:MULTISPECIES: dephospho-CoA kinase [Cryobacterium]TFC49113.1 dephospho-CoA kinase [Cryobacterium shii]TFC83603.1 dephospho-CoA kinase [Cryobacterium sp. TmT2-59]TFD16063.1 dephospho-CoA kinase [Cryobacterium sp. TMT1-21]TFD22034.1 dephospho-CoA kinase [Cryobacterium sp. TMT4-10]TFD28205.1 dephospho-CoA kinase [Cryobacterium sp. TMT2-23]